MSEKEKPKHRWFRFHLLTLVLMALASGGLMLLNSIKFCYGQLPSGGPALANGWPVTFWDEPDYGFISPVALLLDIGCWIVMLSTVALVSECFLRRREARKT